MAAKPAHLVHLWKFAVGGIVFGALAGILFGAPTLAELSGFWGGIVQGRWSAAMARVLADLIGSAAMGLSLFLLIWSFGAKKEADRRRASAA